MKKMTIVMVIVVALVAAVFVGCKHSRGKNLDGPGMERNLAADPNLLPGDFSVSATKTVKFTKSNLYWDGSAFKFEANQYDYQTSWDVNHVSHFFWTKTEANSYAASYSDGTIAVDDVPFFAESQGGLTVEGTEGLYALSSAEWTYLIETRDNASSLYKNGVRVAGAYDCLIIAPDGYTGTIAESYTAEAWATAEALGLVCLPAVGYRRGTELGLGGIYGNYWSSSPYANDADCAHDLVFRSGFGHGEARINPARCYDSRDYGWSLRLVK